MILPPSRRTAGNDVCFCGVVLISSCLASATIVLVSSRPIERYAVGRPIRRTRRSTRVVDPCVHLAGCAVGCVIGRNWRPKKRKVSKTHLFFPWVSSASDARPTSARSTAPLESRCDRCKPHSAKCDRHFARGPKSMLQHPCPVMCRRRSSLWS